MALINPIGLTHGTLECIDIAATRRFYADFLGLDVVRPLKEAQYISKGGEWSVVCVGLGKAPKPQSPENYFEVCVETAELVAAAHDKALRYKDEFGIRDVGAIEHRDGAQRFLLQDLNGAWWAISDFTPDKLDAAFAEKARG